MSAKITILDMDAGSRELIRAALAREKIEGVEVSEEASTAGIAIWLGDRQQSPPRGPKISENDLFIKPVRLGALLDRVRRHLAGGVKSGGKRLGIGPFQLDEQSNELLVGEDRAVRLTDKEKQILLLLSEANGGTVDRKALLDKVWGYAPDLNTHTLETHIYRLRQKIERDPAKPEILLTDGAGYRLVQTV